MPRPVKNKDPLSQIVRRLMERHGVTQQDLAEVFDTSVSVIRNKLSLGRFTIPELAAIAELCGGDLSIQVNGHIYPFLSKEMCDDQTYQRIQSHRKQIHRRDKKRMEDLIRNSDPDLIKSVYKEIFGPSEEYGTPKQTK